MIKYTLEDNNNSSNVFLCDDEYEIKVLVAVVFDKAHAKIIVRKMNEYIEEKTTVQGDDDPFFDKGIAKISPL